jgi:hypothetical protein
MKTIILSVKVPDSAKVTTADFWVTEFLGAYQRQSHVKDFTEIVLPSDEEIESAWFTYDDSQKYEAYLQEQGAKWLKSKILEP